jgi:flagellar biosynthesis/type III secretory pathway protein FliH
MQQHRRKDSITAQDEVICLLGDSDDEFSSRGTAGMQPQPAPPAVKEEAQQRHCEEAEEQQRQLEEEAEEQQQQRQQQLEQQQQEPWSAIPRCERKRKRAPAPAAAAEDESSTGSEDDDTEDGIGPQPVMQRWACVSNVLRASWLVPGCCGGGRAANLTESALMVRWL